MVYKDHEAFEKPSDENTKIWRFLDFTKFVSLLDRKALFFTRIDKLGDPFEGSFSKYPQFSETEFNKLPRGSKIAICKSNYQFRGLRIGLRKCAVVNCWHMNDVESAAMWKLYLKSDEGIAIQSSFQRLVKSFDSYLENDVYIGKVKYIDYEKDAISLSNRLLPFVYKRKSFQHERELRAMIIKVPGKNEEFDFEKAVTGNGIYVPIDMNCLIEEIHLSPFTEEWFKELVKSIMYKYGLNKDPVKSDLNRDPVY